MYKQNNIGKISGVSLVELLIVIAIIGILVAITLPGYQSQTQATRRADCAKVLTTSSIQMERYFASNSYSYAGASAGAGGIISDKCPLDGTVRHYTVSVVSDASTYTLSAAPQGGQTEDSCGTLTIDQAGAQGADASVDDCWR